MKTFLSKALGVALLALAILLTPAALSGQLGLRTGTAYAVINEVGQAGELSDGQILHRSANVPGALYGVPGQGPVTQPTNPSEAAASFALGQSAIVCYSSAQTPGAANANTCAEQAMTITGLQSGSLIFVSKPATQNGIGLAGVRVSAANTAQFNFFNVTAGNITPTAGQAYLVVEIRGPLIQTAALAPAAVAATSTSSQQFTLTPAAGQQGVSSARQGFTSGVTALNQNPPAITTLAVGAVPTPVNQIPVLLGNPQTLIVNKPTGQPGLGVHNCRIVDNNKIEIGYLNTSGAPITPAAETYSFFACRGMSLHGLVTYLVNVGTLAAVAQGTSATQTVTCNGLAASDKIVGWLKPTEQAGLILTKARVSAANTITLEFGNIPNAGGNLTPTGSEVYTFWVDKSATSATGGMILAQFTAVFSPVAVATITGAEQTFALANANGLTPKSASFIGGFNVYACGPSANNGGATANGFNGSAGGLGAPLVTGLVIGGVRMSADNTIAINFANVTGANLTAAQIGQLMITVLLAPTDIAGSAAAAAGSGVSYGYDVQDQQQQEAVWAMEQALIAQGAFLGS